MEQEIEQYNFDFHKETAQIVGGNSDTLNIKIGDFAGPLDLLLFLIRQEQANIFDIPIARITEKYLEYIRLISAFKLGLVQKPEERPGTLLDDRRRCRDAHRCK